MVSSVADQDYLAEQAYQDYLADKACLSGLVSTPRSFTHIATLVNPSTGHEVCLTVETITDRFSDALAATHVERKAQELFGYEVFEILGC